MRKLVIVNKNKYLNLEKKIEWKYGIDQSMAQ